MQHSHAVDGRCMMASGDEYPCTARSITLKGAEILARVSAVKAGSLVICYLDNIGALRGSIREVHKDGFFLDFHMNEASRTRVMARLEWHEMRPSETAEQRAAPRFVPIQRSTQVRLDDKRVIKAAIVDLSMAGVAVTTGGAAQPSIGALVQIGKRFATVVRVIEGGFAAEFKLPFNQETFNHHVVL